MPRSLAAAEDGARGIYNHVKAWTAKKDQIPRGSKTYPRPRQFHFFSKAVQPAHKSYNLLGSIEDI